MGGGGSLQVKVRLLDLRLQEEGRISPSWYSFSLALVSSNQSSDELLSFSETMVS